MTNHQFNSNNSMNNQTQNSIGKNIFPDHLKTLIEQKIERTEVLDAIASVTISPDNQIIAGGGFKSIKVWDFKTGELTYNCQGHSDWVLCVCISQNGWFMASGSADHTINLWKLQNGKSYHTLRGHSDWVTVLAMTPDSKTLVSGSVDKTIKIWDISTGECKYTLTEHSDSISSLAISPDGSFLLSGSADKTIKIWNLKELKVEKSIETISGHSSPIQALSFLNDQGFISGSHDGEIKNWLLKQNKQNNKATQWREWIPAFIIIIIIIFIFNKLILDNTILSQQYLFGFEALLGFLFIIFILNFKKYTLLKKFRVFPKK